jgi:Uma2 family endonuclease
MSTADRLELISASDYLASEPASPVKHEYVDGIVYAMPDTRKSHNLVAGNTFGALHIRLRGRPCEAFNSDTKIRIRFPGHVRFYYPDALVPCRPNLPTDSFQDEPVVIVEVLSHLTRRTDEVEKRDAYLTIPSLTLYLLIEQEPATAIAFRRTATGFVREVYQGLDAVVPVPEIGIDLPLADIYETVEFGPEPEDDDASAAG